jgi:hypothetical protein
MDPEVSSIRWLMGPLPSPRCLLLLRLLTLTHLPHRRFRCRHFLRIHSHRQFRIDRTLDQRRRRPQRRPDISYRAVRVRATAVIIIIRPAATMTAANTRRLRRTSRRISTHTNKHTNNNRGKDMGMHLPTRQRPLQPLSHSVPLHLYRPLQHQRPHNH